MHNRISLVAGLLAAGLAVAAAVTSPASASMLDVDGGTLHHWVEPGPEPSEPPGEDSRGANSGVPDQQSGNGGDAAENPAAPAGDSAPVPSGKQPDPPAEQPPAEQPPAQQPPAEQSVAATDQLGTVAAQTTSEDRSLG